MDILGLCETRSEGNGDYWSDDYRVIHTGREQGRNGTAIVLHKKWGQQVENIIHYSDRLTAVKIKTKPRDVIILQVYMPTGSYSDDEIEDMYNNIDTVLDTV